MSQQINLFNPVFLKQKKHFSLLTMLQALLLIVLGALAFYAYAWYQVQELAQRTNEMSQRYETEQKRLVSYANEFSPERARQALDSELKAAEEQAKVQAEILETLKSGAIGNTQGYSEYLRAFARQSVQGVWLTGFEIVGDGTQMTLRGGVVDAKRLPEYIQRMGREPVMRGKTFAALQMRQPEEVRGYLEFVLHSQADGKAGSK